MLPPPIPVLQVLETGTHGTPVVFCHGLFGQGKNWLTLAKSLAAGTPSYRSLLVDLPNHGRSPWTTSIDYADMAAAVAATVRAHTTEPVAVVGHSMGGKVAMHLALRHPVLVERLCVVDIAPAASPSTVADFGGYAEAMMALDLSRLDSRSSADEQLRAAVPDPVVRGFLLQNLRRESGSDGAQHWTWQCNLRLLCAQLEAVGSWPTVNASYPGPTLWVGGERSSAITPELAPVMRGLFPRVRQVTVKGAGHWVHSEQPAVFAAVLRAFLAERPSRSH